MNLNDYLLISKKTTKQFPPKNGEVRIKKYKKKGVETIEWFSWIDGKWKYHPIPDEFRKPVGGALPAGTIVEDKNKDGKVLAVRQKQEDGSWKYVPLPKEYRSNYENMGLPEGTIRVDGTRTYKKQNREWVLVEQRMKKSSLPEGTVRYKNCGKNGNGITQKKINGKWITVYKDRENYIIPENTPIGKYGPRPELRQLIYGVGINDVMIPEFTTSRIWRQWCGIIRRCDNNDPKWLKGHMSYSGCTLDSRWIKLSAFKEWVEQWDDYENKEVDKDILITGNKVYGPDTCLMVRKSVNAWFKPFYTTTGKLPIGVTWNTAWKTGKSSINPYRAQITPLKSGKRTSLGLFPTVEEASAAFESAKKEQIKILIESETDLKVKNALLKQLDITS